MAGRSIPYEQRLPLLHRDRHVQGTLLAVVEFLAMEEEVWLSAEVVSTLLAIVEEEVWPSAEVMSTLLAIVEEEVWPSAIVGEEVWPSAIILPIPCFIVRSRRPDSHICLISTLHSSMDSSNCRTLPIVASDTALSQSLADALDADPLIHSTSYIQAIARSSKYYTTHVHERRCGCVLYRYPYLDFTISGDLLNCT